MTSVLREIASFAYAAIRQRPLMLNSATGAILFSSSDALAQEMEESGLTATASNSNHHNGGDDDNDLLVINRRFLSAAAIGIFFGGFVYPFAYRRLDLLIPGVHWSAVVCKSLVEICTVGIFVNSISMLSRGLLVGRDAHHVAFHVMEEMPSVTKNDFSVWMPYNLLAFSVIPSVIRPTTTAFMEASWQTYISLRSHDYVTPKSE